jgi:hypothetical protein
VAVGWLWVAGAVVWFLRTALRTRRFHRLLRYAQPAPTELQEQAAGLAAQMGLGVCPDIWLVPGPLPPLVWSGLGPPRLYFPADLLQRLTQDERASLLVHELAHVRRRDHWVRWLEVMAMGLYWWYPVVWWTRRQLQAREEECCDAWVVGQLPPCVYAAAILETVDFLAERGLAPAPVASGLGGFHLLRRRLIMIMQQSTPKRLSWAGRFAVVTLAAGLLPLLPRPGSPKSAEPAPAAASATALQPSAGRPDEVATTQSCRLPERRCEACVIVILPGRLRPTNDRLHQASAVAKARVLAPAAAAREVGRTAMRLRVFRFEIDKLTATLLARLGRALPCHGECPCCMSYRQLATLWVMAVEKPPAANLLVLRTLPRDKSGAPEQEGHCS